MGQQQKLYNCSTGTIFVGATPIATGDSVATRLFTERHQPVIDRWVELGYLKAPSKDSVKTEPEVTEPEVTEPEPEVTEPEVVEPEPEVVEPEPEEEVLSPQQKAARTRAANKLKKQQEAEAAKE